MLDDYFRHYGLIAIFLAVAVAVPAGMLVMSWLFGLLKIRPRVPTPIKLSIYECGFETLTKRWNMFNFRYYSLALDFVVFDVEVVYLLPWAAAFGFLAYQMGMYFLIPMVVFMVVLVLGWLYAWRKGSLEWG